MCLIKEQQQSGFSLVELMVVITVGGILIALTMVMMTNTVENSRLRGATEALYADILHAQTYATSNGNNVYFKVSAGSDWCYGISTTSACDCSASSCLLDSKLYKNAAIGYPNVTLTAVNFSNELLFNSTQGTISSGIVSSPASFIFANSTETANVSVSEEGIVSYCSDDLAGYPAC